MTDTNDSGLPKPPRVEVTAAWLAEQRAKQLAYQVERAKWTAALGGRLLSGMAQSAELIRHRVGYAGALRRAELVAMRLCQVCHRRFPGERERWAFLPGPARSGAPLSDRFH